MIFVELKSLMEGALLSWETGRDLGCIIWFDTYQEISFCSVWTWQAEDSNKADSCNILCLSLPGLRR